MTFIIFTSAVSGLFGLVFELCRRLDRALS